MHSHFLKYNGLSIQSKNIIVFLCIGFKTGNTACCGIGKYNGFLTCLRGLKPCDNVEDHFYWDAYHPTSKFYPQLIDILWNNGPPYTYPKSLQEEFQPMKQHDNFHTEL